MASLNVSAPSATISVFVPAGGVELCVQEGRSQGSSCLCCPAKPSFDHAKPDSLPLSHSEWGQFQTKVQNAVAGMKSERMLVFASYIMVVPWILMGIIVYYLVMGSEDGRRLRAGGATHGASSSRSPSMTGDGDSGFLRTVGAMDFEDLGLLGYAVITSIALCVVSVALSMWISSRNQRQDELISSGCSELASGSGGRLTAEYHTFNTGWVRATGRQPHRVIVIAPSQQAQAVAAEVVPGAYGAFAQPAQASVVAQPAQVAYAEEP